MSDFTTPAHFVRAFYRLVGSKTDDAMLVEQGESADDIAYIALTRGIRSAQRYMLGVGYQGWRKRSSSALTFTGTDAADGGKKSTLPSDFLRAYGTGRPGRSALVEANGDRWGTELKPDEDHIKGPYWYIRGEELWLARNAQTPASIYLDYHYRHPVFTGDVTIDFPLEARSLVPAEAAVSAMDENWLPGGSELKASIYSARTIARDQARQIARPTKTPRVFKAPVRIGNRW